MKRIRVTTRLARSFSGLFLFGILLISVFAYYELVIEPVLLPEEHVSVPHVILEIASEAAIPVALLCFGGWWLARRAMQPLEVLANAADRIHEGNLRDPIQLARGDAEFVRLAEVFNAMTRRLDDSFQRIRQFTLYASHELKTPLTVLRAEFERMADDPARGEADRAAAARLLDEIERLALIVDGLAFLTKADSQLITLARETVLLKPLVMAAVEDAAVLGAERRITVALERCDDARIVGDRHRLRQLLVILCDNAVKYNHADGFVRISLTEAVGLIRISVINSGPGIPDSERDRVFERFYRGSNVKADGIEGAGLGLSIAQWIATAHVGTLSFTSVRDRTEFVFEAGK